MADKKPGTACCWKVHVRCLLQEIASNSEQPALKIPLQMLGILLHAVGERASQLNDDELNALMARLAIYEISDPTSPNYDSRLTEELISKGRQDVLHFKEVARAEAEVSDRTDRGGGSACPSPAVSAIPPYKRWQGGATGGEGRADRTTGDRPRTGKDGPRQRGQ